METIRRCPWANGTELINYHDQEWGRELHDGPKLYELLMLEAMQSGLSWLTILKKREHMREVFDHFQPEKIAQYQEEKVQELLRDPGILRNERKIRAVIRNAQCYMKLQERGIHFEEYIWEFCGHRPLLRYPESMADLPSYDERAVEMSKALKKEGFQYVGPVVCYAFMQSAGMVNDHMVWCFCRNEERGCRSASASPGL